jgi:ABC-type proline/glycine betaine transport system permease subunit
VEKLYGNSSNYICSTLVCIVVGIPIGVLMSKSSRAEKAILPV